MIGSPDLLAFTGTEGFGDGPDDRQDAQVLPEELSVPLLPPSHPWISSSNAQFHRDFILVAEFSEQVGPQPVRTIPDDPGVLGSFDLSHFSVRLMSVDYQASCPAPSASASTSPGPRLNFSEDSKVILGDSAESAFAYVHHLTLYDLEARGMVRPFCMAYVSSDQLKLMEHFTELSTYFTRASDSLKTGNRRAFASELQRKLRELEHKRFTLQREAELQRSANESVEFGAGETANELAAVECSIQDHRELLRQVTSYPNRKLKQPDFLPYDPADDLADSYGSLSPSLPPSPSLSSTCSRNFERRLKSLEELCDTYFLSLTMEQLMDTERRLRGDRSALHTNRVIRALSRKLMLTNFLFELWNAEEEVEEEEREGEAAELQGVRGGRNDAMTHSAEQPSPESFFSCVEEIPIKLEAAGEGAVTPDPEVTMEMLGSMSSGDSIEVLGTEKSYRTQGIVTGNDIGEMSVGLIDTCVKRVASEAAVRRVRAYARRANSEDSIEVLSTTESIFPDDLTAITEEEPEHRILGNGFLEEEAPVQEEESTRHVNDVQEEEDEPIQEEGSLRERTLGNEGQGEAPVQVEDTVHREESLKQRPMGNEVQDEEEPLHEDINQANEDSGSENRLTPLQAEEEAVEAVRRWSDGNRSGVMVRPVPYLQVDLAPALPVALGEMGHWAPPNIPFRLLSVDEASDCTSFNSSSPCTSDAPSLTPSLHSNHWVQRRRRRRKAGTRALRFLQQNSFSQHAVYCLLSGRPLVVIGGDEKSVRKLVSALALFLPAPGLPGNAVLPCLTTPLQMTDLLTWRLIGIHRSPATASSSMLPSLARYSRYLALLDLDQKTLRCPSYSGSVVSRLADPLTAICRGKTYLLHLESGLTALTNYALLFTFNPALHLPDVSVEVAKRKDFLLGRGFCSSEDDLRVIYFLSDLIKQRHAGRGPPVLSFSYSPMHRHRNTTAT